MQDGFITIPATTGIRIMDADGTGIVFSSDWTKADASMCMQDGMRTVKIFKGEEPFLPETTPSFDDSCGNAPMPAIMSCRHASRVAFIDGFVRFERYGLYAHGCNISVKDGVITITPLRASE